MHPVSFASSTSSAALSDSHLHIIHIISTPTYYFHNNSLEIWHLGICINQLQQQMLNDHQISTGWTSDFLHQFMMRRTIEKSLPQPTFPVLKTGMLHSSYFLRAVNYFAWPSTSSNREHIIAYIPFCLGFCYPNIEVGSDCELFLRFTVNLGARSAHTDMILL